MKKIFDDLRTAIEGHSVNCGRARIVDYHIVRTFINRAEAELEAESCEWVHKRYGANCMSGCARVFMNYELLLGFKHCPYCGRKIKITEVE